ncbi:unannotated protein [freshwater metagenome]|uniref:Unannotated protein n=1 Tax=freshwater metagenome TaxID=449393 RepID=A0A6J7M0U5_9ZZZZ
MSRSSLRRSSTTKHAGAAMSSRLIPPNDGAMFTTVRMISSGSLVSRQIGKPSTPANSLNSSALPSMTGIAPSGPMSPRPRTAVPSLTMATVFLRMVRSCESNGSFSIAVQIRATPGVYAIERSSRSFTGMRLMTCTLPPACNANVRSSHSRSSISESARTASSTCC